MKTLKNWSAEGTKGCLLIYPDFDTAVPTGKLNKFGQKIVQCKDWIAVFRIYERDEDGKCKLDKEGDVIFKDYEIRHSDLDITLNNGQFYETDEGNYLDYPNLELYK